MELQGFSTQGLNAQYILGTIMPKYTKETDPNSSIQLFTKPEPQSYHLLAKQIGPINPRGIPYVTDRTPASMIEGAKKRIIPKTPKPDPKYLRAVGATVRHILRQLVPLEPLELNEHYIDEFLQHYDKPLKTKKALREAFFDVLSTPLTKRDYIVKTFAKKEFYENEKYSRLIMVRSLRLKALLSNAIHKCDEYLFHHSPLSKYFIKGMTPQEQVDAMAKRFEGHSLFLETDYSSFESSFSPQYQKVVEIAFWKHMLKNNPVILDAVLKSYGNHKILGPGFRIMKSGGRMSGDLWTSSMNGFSNLVNIMTLARLHNIEFDGFVEGDDGLFWMNHDTLTPEDYARLGFIIKMDYKHRIQDCSFCGKVFDEKSKHVLGTPEQINRVGWTLEKSYWRAKPEKQKELLASKALSLAVLYPGCPCIQARAKSILAAVGKHRFKRHHFDSNYTLSYMQTQRNMTIDKIYESLTFPEPTPEDRMLYEERFGVSVNQQLVYERRVLEDPWADVPLEISDVFSGGLNNLDHLFRFKDSAIDV